VKLATVSQHHLATAAQILRGHGEDVVADALLDLTDGHDALVIEGGEPLPQPLKIADFEKVTKLARDLAAARADLAQFIGLSVIGPFAEVIFYARIPPSGQPRRLFSFDTDRASNTAVETVDLFEVVSAHVKKRVEVLERELRALGVDPTVDPDA